MEFREVEKQVKGCLGGAFTGKVVVRIVDGEILAVDVGAAGTGIPHLSHAEAMRRCPQPEAPDWRDYMTDEEREGLAAADDDLRAARAELVARYDELAEAESGLRSAEAGAIASQERARLTAGTSEDDGTALYELSRAVEGARAKVVRARGIEEDALSAHNDLELKIARSAGVRLREALEPKPGEPAPGKPGWRERLTAAAARVQG